jgi:hypothetical protein
VRTRILDAARNRPHTASAGETDGMPSAVRETGRQLVESGMAPAQVADKVVDGVRSGRFYILTHPEMNPAITRRTEAVVAGGPPPLARLG